MKKRFALLAVSVSLLALLGAWTMKRQEVVPQPCPFDPALSVGVAFSGPHRYFDTGEVQEKTLNARIAWFQPVEQPNPDAFDERVSQEPPEDDWDWWTTLYPTTLVVQVTDTQNRLGKVEVWDFETKLLDGQLQASSDGSSVVGSLTLEEPTSFRHLVVKDKGGQVLAHALVKDPEARLWIVASRAGWIPHPPPRDIATEIAEQLSHEGGHTIVTEVTLVKEGGQLVVKQMTENCSCTIQRYLVKEGCPPHTGEINEQHFVGLYLTIGTPPQGCSMLDTRVNASCGTWVDVTNYPISFDVPYCMTKRFRNDSPNQINVDPPKVYANKHVPVKLNVDLRSYPLVTKDEPSQAALVSELEAMQDERGTTLLTTPIPVLPYSEGCVHWDLRVEQAAIRGIWAVPYRKYKKTRSWFEEFLLTIHKPLLTAIMGRHINRKELLVMGAIEAWVKGLEKAEGREKEEWRWNDAKPIGDIWVLYLQLAGQGLMPYSRNITQNVRVQITVGGQPMYGSVQVERLEATTNPPPPRLPIIVGTYDVPPEGREIALGKGWKWRLTGYAAGRQASVVVEIPTETPSVVIKVPAPQPPPGQG